MKIKKFYCEKNEITDISGDYCKIEMSTDIIITIKNLLNTGNWYSTELKAKAKAIYKALDEALDEAETEWY